MDSLHENSIHAISAIQKSFDDQKNVMFLLSNMFDPRYAFLFYAPLVFSLDWATGRKLMWVTVIAEWSNQILKWLMRGERPYWWVHEFSQSNQSAGGDPFVGTKLPHIEQTFMTCETGPGSPSGHAMATAAVWYILVEAMLKRYTKSQGAKGSQGNSVFNSVCWSAYTFVLCCVSLSRIYLAAHFPHQCLLGMGMGVAVAILVSNLNTDRVTRNGYLLGTAGMFASAMLTYALLLALGFNPLWSVERALKWCAKREHVHLDTSPFFSMMRYSGFFLGMGLGLHSRFHRAISGLNFSGSMKAVTAALSLAVSKAIEKAPISTESLHVNAIYAIVFVQSLLLPYIFVAVVPYLVAKFHPHSKKESVKTDSIKAANNNSQDSNNNSIIRLKAQ